MQRLRFGIVGLGAGKHEAGGPGLGRSQALAIRRDRRGAVTALCDVDRARLGTFAAELEDPVRRYLDYRELCRDPEVDAVFIATPNPLHGPVVLEAVRAGKHVLCATPLSDQDASAPELVRAAEAAGVVNMMCLPTRYGGPVQYLGRLARRGELGELYYGRARTVCRSGIPDSGSHCIGICGGGFRNAGVHVLDAAWWMLGCPEPVAVAGVAGARFGPRGLGYRDYNRVSPALAAQYAADDYAAAMIRFTTGAGLLVESFWASHHPDELQIELFGTEGGARLDPLTLYRTVEGRPADTAVSPPPCEGLDEVARHFIACVLDGIPCEASLRHGLTVQQMLEAALRSGQTGAEVQLG